MNVPSQSSVAMMPADHELSTVIKLFERQARLSADSVAVVFEETELTYQQLDELASRFATAYHQAGIRRGQTVGLCIDRRPEAIAAMLGAFKIGAIYVPLDPDYPADRVRYMIEDADIQAIVTHDLSTNALASQLHESFASDPSNHRNLVWIDSASANFLSTPINLHTDYPTECELAYIMYTSGSTGMPKGVQIEHRSLVVYCEADIDVYQLTPKDRTLQFSTLNFDIAIEEIFPPLITGGVVVIRPQNRSSSSNELSAIIDRYQVTAIHIATAYWHEWVDLMVATQATAPSSLRLVIATGEKISVEHYRRWKKLCFQPVMWCNAYGPTETTVTATVFIPDESFNDDHMPIGKPLKGYQAWVLDDRLQPLGVGETGQLFISGPALARGYHNNSDKTNAAFLHTNLPGYGPIRIYRTGDLARWLPSGDIEYAGRVDHQIKVGSYRIEPGEIEVAIAKFEGVLESIVIHEEVGGQKFLIAYVATGNHSISVKALQDHLRNVLPVYMVPPRYVTLESLPKTINGKIDRRSLPPASESVPATESVGAESATDTEAALAEIWRSVLNYPSVSVEDDFFALGGSSLLVTRVVAAVTVRFGIELPVRDFFANPTIRSSAAHIDRLVAKRSGIELQSSANDESSREYRNRLPQLHGKLIPIDYGHLFSVRYQPRRNRLDHAILMCNSIGHEQTRAARNLQQLAVQLADLGYDVLRYDYRGTGNSSGDCDQCTATTLIEDTRMAATYLRQQTTPMRFSAIGVRLGGTVLTNAQIDFIDDMILWDPINDGGQFVEMLDRFHDLTLTNQTRFTKVMKRSPHDQAYGHSMNELKRKSLGQLRLLFDKRAKLRHEMICSNGYLEREAGLSVPPDHWKVQHLQDSIFWHDLEYAERAFASPAAFRSIIELLQNRPVNQHSEPSVPMPVSVSINCAVESVLS